MSCGHRIARWELGFLSAAGGMAQGKCELGVATRRPHVQVRGNNPVQQLLDLRLGVIGRLR
jgi:hypothetical protein